MGYWCFRNIGFECPPEQKALVKEIFECMGVDFEDVLHGSESGVINPRFYDNVVNMGVDNSDLAPAEVYMIVNRLVGQTTVFYEFEEGNNTSDNYYRYEEIYNPYTKRIEIGEIDFCYGDRTVFGESPYSMIKKECEQAAAGQGVKVEWDEEYGTLEPKDGAFYVLCEEVLNEHGGLRGLGTRTHSEEIPSVSIKNERIIQITDTATKRGCSMLVEHLRREFGTDEVIRPKPDNKKQETKKNEPLTKNNKTGSEYYARYIHENLEKNGNEFEVTGTQYDGRCERIEEIHLGDSLILKREPQNEYDSNAIDLLCSTGSVGHLPAFVSKVLAKELDAGKITATAVVTKVEPLSKRSKRAKKPLLFVRIVIKEATENEV